MTILANSLEKRPCNLCDGTDKSCWRCAGKGWFYVWPDGTPYVYQGRGGLLYTQSAQNIARASGKERMWL